MGGERISRPMDWVRPVPPVRREVLAVTPVVDEGRPPLLFVPGFGHGAWVYAQWLEHAAGRGFPAYAMSLRGHGISGSAPGWTGLRAYAHDVAQVAAKLPRQAVVVGHGAGALVVARALARYPARAGVLLAPVLGGLRSGLAVLTAALVRNPLGTLPALVGGGLRLRRGQLFSRELPAATAAAYASRLGRASVLAQWQVLLRTDPPPPAGNPPMLVVGSPDDRIVPRSTLERAARRYGGAPLLFAGMGHDLMLDARWQEPIDAILDWLRAAPPAAAAQRPAAGRLNG